MSLAYNESPLNSSTTDRTYLNLFSITKSDQKPLEISNVISNINGSPAKAVSVEELARQIALFNWNMTNVGSPKSGSYSSSTYGSPTNSVTSSVFSPLFKGPLDIFSRKVFVGGLPPDIDEEEISATFCRFGPCSVDWPHKAESKSYFPPKGYAFLIFELEGSVHMLLNSCSREGDKYFLAVSSPTMKCKSVQLRPWVLSDANFVVNPNLPLDARKTVFVGGVPRPLKASELAAIMEKTYGGVCYAGIDTDPELKYPKGAGRVGFNNDKSYIAAISGRFVQLQIADIDKRAEVKPYVLDDQVCDECNGVLCHNKYAPFFCPNIACLQYYCEICWIKIHRIKGRENHKPLIKEGSDRPRVVSFNHRWI